MSPRQPEQTAAFIDHAGNVSFHGGNYSQQNIQTIDTSSKSGIDLLLQKASLDAMHDASARDPPPRCSEGTRKKVLADIMTWIKDPQPRESILWLNGPFGNGKTAIMQTIAETLRKDPQASDLLAGSFFFGRGLPGRDKAEYLIPTIAYQMASNIPGMQKIVETALSKHPTIFSKSIDTQFRCLITEPLTTPEPRSITEGLLRPFSRLRRSPSPGRFRIPIVIIDGLDECDVPDSQQLILNAISTAVLEDHIKLRFLIASRPEAHINERFVTQPLNEHHYPITLDDGFETRQELLEHLRAGFDAIFKRKSMMFVIGIPWPSEKELEELARRASGQFLYAATVLRFVDSDDAHPSRQLELILTRQPGSISAFSTMDELYMLILQSLPSTLQRILRSFLRSVVFLREVGGGLARLTVNTRANLEIISGRQTEDISVILRWLPAVVAVTGVEQRELPAGYPWQDFVHYYSPTISTHHQSFIEFLTNKKRSDVFFADPDIARRAASTRLDVLVAECLLQGKTSRGCIHSSTWSLATFLLVKGLNAHGIHPSLGWPRLQKILAAFQVREGSQWNPALSPEFFNAIEAVCNALRDAYRPDDDHLTPPQTADIENCLDACMRIYYSVYIQRLSSLPASTFWKIAAAVSLPHLMPSAQSCDVAKDVVEVSKITGIPIQTTLQILKQNWYFFRVDQFGIEKYSLCISIKPEVLRIILHEVHSESFYSEYRRSVILEFKSKLVNMWPLTDVAGLGTVFLVFVRYRWDIRPKTDVKEAASMQDIIKLLHGCLHKRSWEILKFRDGFAGFGWLCRQLHIVKPWPKYEKTTKELQEIIELLLQNDVLEHIFSESNCWFWRNHSCVRLPPFGISIYEDSGNLPTKFFQLFDDVQVCYSEASFLWKDPHGISAKCHTVIIGYYTSVLLSCMAGRFPNKVRNLGFKMVSDVAWEQHFQQIPANAEFRNRLLTVHYLVTKRNDLIRGGSVSKVVKQLPLSFLKGSLTWYRARFQGECIQTRGDRDYRGEGFESWCEKIIAKKRQ